MVKLLITNVKSTRTATSMKRTNFKTSLDLIEIDITFKCNLMCYNCDRSCRQAPEENHMSIEQISRFLAESTNKSHKWKRIRILGGEPYLHPEIDLILELLSDYKLENKDTIVEVVTNGYGQEVNKAILKTPINVEIKNTKKTSQFNTKFEPFNVAPKDLESSSLNTYTEACWITEECGFGFNCYGFYQCAVAGSIDRVLGLDIGLKQLPSQEEQLVMQKEKLCAYCGHFLNQKFIPPDNRTSVDGEPQTVSWKRAYSEYKRQKPFMSLY